MPFAWRLITHKKSRTAVACAGVGFAILVLFVQLGFYGAIVNTAEAVTQELDAELVLVSPRFVHLSDAGTIDRGRLFQSLAVPDVTRATPLYFRYADWRDPATAQRCRLFAVAFPISTRFPSPLGIDAVTQQLTALRPNGSLLLDTLTQDKCGPREGDEAQVRGQTTRIVGSFELGVGFLADGALVLSDESFSRLFDNYPLTEPHLGLLKLRPGADVEAVAAQVREVLPADVRVLTRADLSAIQRKHWVRDTAAGNIFAMGAVAGFFVGLVILYQILSTDIRNHLPLYATLKAMGYSRSQLHRYVLEKAWIYALIGFGPAAVLTGLLFPLVHDATRLPLFVTPWLIGGVLLLSLSMCTSAALLSTRRLQGADPAELF